jgi:hypothetical protein
MINNILDLLKFSSENLFWVSAVLGTTFFLLRVSMALFGATFLEDHADFDHSHDHGHHNFSLFKFLTFHSLAGFLMMFGWSGLAGLTQFGLASQLALLVGLVCGMLMLLITGFIMHAAKILEGPGVVFSIQQTIGLVGTVYQSIPAKGLGKVHVVVNNMTRELLAQSAQHVALESFTLIKVVKVIDHETVEVTEFIGESL